MKNNFKKLLHSDRFVVIIGLIVVPLFSFMLITIGDESPLYTSISRIAWVHGEWLLTFVWALVVMCAIGWITHLLVYSGPLSDGAKQIFMLYQSINIILTFVGCIIFPAKDGVALVRLVNYLHDYLTVVAWALYGLGLLFYSFVLKRHDRFLGFLGLGLMSFIILSSAFFVSNVIDATSYVGASAVAEVYIINSFLIYLVVMYLFERVRLESPRSRTNTDKSSK